MTSSQEQHDLSLENKQWFNAIVDNNVLKVKDIIKSTVMAEKERLLNNPFSFGKKEILVPAQSHEFNVTLPVCIAAVNASSVFG
jgi:hypothetical protein